MAKSQEVLAKLLKRAAEGLGAPLGAVLAGPKDFIGQAWRWKQRLGGSMRQGGMNAAACIYALQHNIDRLAQDHANAAALARGMGQIPGITVETPETNLVFFDTKGTGLTAADFAARLRPHGVTISVSDTFRGRACTHQPGAKCGRIGAADPEPGRPAQGPVRSLTAAARISCSKCAAAGARARLRRVTRWIDGTWSGNSSGSTCSMPSRA